MTIRLDKYAKQAFVSAVMADVPKIDYQTPINKLVLEAQEWYLKKHFPAVLAFMKSEHGSMLGRKSVGFSNSWKTGISSVSCLDCFVLSPEVKNACDVIIQTAMAQATARSELEVKVSGLIAGCHTVKTALKLLPEFEKYLPKVDTPTANLPALANVIADLSKAGWPKGATPTVAKKPAKIKHMVEAFAD